VLCVVQVEEIANIAANNKLFGGNCTVPRVLQEMMSEWLMVKASLS
jgi:hypothetical protein